MDEIERTVVDVNKELFSILLQLQDEKYEARQPGDQPISAELLGIHWVTMHQCVDRLGMMVTLGERGGWDTTNGALVGYQRMDELRIRVKNRLLEETLDLLLDMTLIGLGACALLKIEAWTSSPHWNEFANLRDADAHFGRT